MEIVAISSTSKPPIISRKDADSLLKSKPLPTREDKYVDSTVGGMPMTQMSTKSANKASSAETKMPPPQAPPNTGGSYSGLSALILAATSQLGHLIDNDAASASEEGSHLTPALESDGDMRVDSPPPPSSSQHLSPYLEERTAQIVVPHEQQHQKGENSDKQLAFPEQLMKLLMDPANEDIATFLPDGKYFAIRRKVFSDKYLYKTFHLTTYDEFLELMRGWGFIRVNANHAAAEEHEEAAIKSAPSMTSSTTSGAAAATTSSTCTGNGSSKAAIQVFKHPQHQHFKKGHPVDMEKIRFLLGKGHSSARQQNHDTASAAAFQLMKATASPKLTGVFPRGAIRIEHSVSDDSSTCNFDAAMNNAKRRLSPSHLNRDSDDTLQKQRMIMDHLHHASSHPQNGGRLVPCLSNGSPEQQQQPTSTARMARRRSSLELRSMASEITTSKLKVQSNEEGEDAEDDDAEKTESFAAAVSPTAAPQVHPHANSADPSYRSHIPGGGRKKERRLSSASLVDGAVEAATHTIVTDAIETLLFDESHTRETYLKHEKELSVSSLPGVVPISKQLFAGRPRTESGFVDASTTKNGNCGAPPMDETSSGDASIASQTIAVGHPSMPASLSAAALAGSSTPPTSVPPQSMAARKITAEQQDLQPGVAAAAATASVTTIASGSASPRQIEVATMMVNQSHLTHDEAAANEVNRKG